MKFFADLHIHSKFSRATSRDMVLDILARWAKIKGITLLPTADFTHPEWLFLIREKLQPGDDGFFRLKNIMPSENEYLRNILLQPEDVAFILSTEISFIYSKKGRVRKIHILVLAPDFENVDKINTKLAAVGNLRSDGRPILGWDAKQFIKMVADTCPRCMVIPAHIWTPWFSLFGANSGFEAIEECFEEVTPFIFALETGLSSDPPMNRRLSALDKYTLVSNSDAHSPDKIGREGNFFDTEFSYDGLVDAVKSGDPQKFLYTVEFFPQEGKYHYDGHRKCGVAFSPKESIRHNDVCPHCGKKLTKGVLHRVEELADREEDHLPPFRIPYKNLIPLNEIIAQSLGKSSSCKSVWDTYFRMIRELGNEHHILTEIPVENIIQAGFNHIGKGIDRMRKGNVHIAPGHDGTYGIIKLYDEEMEDENNQGQLQLF
ncbi:MAG: DNA helicase UvrD [Candidatus Aminicenantes bacterium]|nr:DNA helicase UvrD [Candidatus Aminicenantes bacterium]